MAKKKVTSSDVAKRAGVSQATVSMVLNKKYNVSFSKEVIHLLIIIRDCSAISKVERVSFSSFASNLVH